MADIIDLDDWSFRNAKNAGTRPNGYWAEQWIWTGLGCRECFTNAITKSAGAKDMQSEIFCLRGRPTRRCGPLPASTPAAGSGGWPERGPDMLSILVFLLVAALLTATGILFYALGAGRSMAQTITELRANGWTIEPPSAEAQAREAVDDGNR